MYAKDIDEYNETIISHDTQKHLLNLLYNQSKWWYYFQKYVLRTNSVSKLKVKEVDHFIMTTQVKTKLTKEQKKAMYENGLYCEGASLYMFEKMFEYVPEFKFYALYQKHLPRLVHLPIEYTDRYEYGWIYKHSFQFYIRFYNTMVLRFNHSKIKDVLDHLSQYPLIRFRIYQSQNHIIAFVTNESLSYTDSKMSYDMGSDPYYAIHSRHHGYVLFTQIHSHRMYEFIMDLNVLHPNSADCMKDIKVFEEKLGLDQAYHDTINDQLFYDSYLNTMKQLAYKPCPYSDQELRKFIFNKHGINYDTVVNCSPGVIPLVNGPQRCIYTDTDYFVGVEMKNNTYYVCYKDILMIDIDFKYGPIDITGLPFRKTDSYLVQRSANGYHIYVTNRRFDLTSKEAIDYMIEFKSDITYIMCCYIKKGTTVRVNRKHKDEDPKIYETMSTINQDLVDPTIIERIRVQIKYIREFQDQFIHDVN